ncbi:MAG: hypothetical protein V1874_14640 [Spirochaetota bacterium]
MKKLQISLSFILVFLAVCCAGKQIEDDKIKRQIDVFGVYLSSSVEYKEINGDPAVEESCSCSDGYDLNFDVLDITIGYTANKKIRKITTYNPGTSMFGIRPGMSFSSSRQKILDAGFSESGRSFMFTNGRYLVTFLVEKKDDIFGLIIETAE